MLRTGRQVQSASALALVGVLGVLSGCGGTAEDAAKGKQLFVQKCGSCHVLADANTRGVIGPNLDLSFSQAIADGEGRDTVRGVVREQIKVPLPTGQMPANLVEGKDASDVAAYVAGAVGKTGGGGGTSTTQGGTVKANAKDEVQIPTDPTGQLAFKFTGATAKAGKVTLLSKNASPVPHNISIKGNGVNQQGATIANGKTSKVAVTLKPGQYEFYCSVPGHEQAGMKGTLTVK